LHSFNYTKAKDYEGKKVVVVGACTSGAFQFVCTGYAFYFFPALEQILGHDIAKDLHDHGVGTFLIICFAHLET
jgi:hypothetical protein